MRLRRRFSWVDVGEVADKATGADHSVVLVHRPCRFLISDRLDLIGSERLRIETSAVCVGLGDGCVSRIVSVIPSVCPPQGHHAGGNGADSDEYSNGNDARERHVAIIRRRLRVRTFPSMKPVRG
jgi:hypothetical protein